MSPVVLVSLRCPRRCYLGSVVATPDGPRVVTVERALVHHSAERAGAQRQEHGPYALDELIPYGCRHSAGNTLQEAQRAALADLVASVRRGDTRPGVSLTVDGGGVA